MGLLNFSHGILYPLHQFFWARTHSVGSGEDLLLEGEDAMLREAMLDEGLNKGGDKSSLDSSDGLSVLKMKCNHLFCLVIFAMNIEYC